MDRLKLLYRRDIAYRLKIVRHRLHYVWVYRKIPKLAWFFFKFALVKDLFRSYADV